MMTEISLNVLDVSENSTRAGASLGTILVTADTVHDKLTIVIDRVKIGRASCRERV